MEEAYALTLADREFYMPLARAVDTGPRWRPAGVPRGWSGEGDGVWTHWRPERAAVAAEGWKIHVSTARDRVRFTLDTVAAACFAEGVTFKHLAAPLFFTAFHHKYATCSQAGKFCALYPPDVATARRLLERLSHDLAGESGPFVLTDRQYGGGGVVFYRYGAFAGLRRTRPDGRTEHLVRDGHGQETEDVRSTTFVLPPGIEDPFAPPPRPFEGPILLNGRFEVTEVVRHSNGGGAYRATDRATGAAVFVKEARPHNGLLGDGEDARDRLGREWRMLRRVHAAAPGLCPEPVDRFSIGDHEFLVTELVGGDGFITWVSANTTVGRLDVPADRAREYYERVQRVLGSLRDALDRLHAIGLRFGDLSHGNVLVGEDLTVRLIDFETAGPLTGVPSALGTPGYKPSAEWTAAGAGDDDYGFAGLALCGLFPLHQPLERDPEGRLELLRRDVDVAAEVPEELWRAATRFHGRRPDGAATAGHGWALPSAAELDERPERALGRLRDGLAQGLLAMARPDFPDWVFPPSPKGLSVNTTCAELGTAGVLYALHHSGVPVPGALVDRLRRDALRQRTQLAPGLQTGLAGIAWTLGDLGLRQEAGDLLAAALRHPLREDSFRLSTGSSGIGLAALARYARDGGEHLLTAAAELADRLLEESGALVRESAGGGLSEGLSGAALFLHGMGAALGDERYRAGARRLAHAELDAARDDGEDGLRFAEGSGVMPQLETGAAGVATVLTRLARDGDERSAAALPRVLRACRRTCAVEPGLYTGVAGWAFALAGYADLTGDAGDRRDALRVAGALAKHVTRHPGGLRVLGSYQTRWCADLATGSAGVLLALARVLDGPGVPLFTTGAALPLPV